MYLKGLLVPILTLLCHPAGLNWCSVAYKGKKIYALTQMITRLTNGVGEDDNCFSNNSIVLCSVCNFGCLIGSCFICNTISLAHRHTHADKHTHTHTWVSDKAAKFPTVLIFLACSSCPSPLALWSNSCL